LLTRTRDKLGLDRVGFALWDGSRVPSDWPADALTLCIRDEQVVAALLRRPKIDTFANLWVTGRVDLTGGSLFDLVDARPRAKTRDLLTSLGKFGALTTALSFWRLGRGGPWPLDGLGETRRGKDQIDTNRENVQYHYDVSNAFYQLILDPEMVYSCGYFTDWDNDLATAQRAKLEMICRKLRLRQGERFLDIGCGWGALVCHAATRYGVYAHGITLSQEQHDLALEKVRALGLADRVTIEMRDYSKMDEKFDKIASIGMFEHVGLANHEAYFASIHRLLKPGGLYLHHAITRTAKRSAKRFRRRRPEHVAMARYIFPGGELDHIGLSVANLQRHGFEVHDVEGWREHYAHTCRHWHDNLLANRAAAEAEVGSVKTRLWLIYLAGCSIAFSRNTLSIYQTLGSRRQRGPSGLPPTRADLYR
jgi:cyclopropane-fatty-acyl-phospholipid synthase